MLAGVRATFGHPACYTAPSPSPGFDPTFPFSPSPLHTMGILAWIVVGLIAGFVAEQVTKTSMGLLMNLAVGIVGAFIGGFIMNQLGGTGITGFNLWSIVVAIIGAIVLLLIINLIRKNT